MTSRTLLMLLLWFIIILIAMAGLFYLTFCADNAYYTRVDNGLVSEITPRSGMSYRYELPAYDKRAMCTGSTLKPAASCGRARICV